MLSRDRRFGFRVPLEIFLTQYIDDRPFRALTSNISGTGMRLETLAQAGPRLRLADRGIGLEFELPGTGEVIWARGEACHERASIGPILSLGIRFTGMPRVHQRLVRDFCIEARHTYLDSLLASIHEPRAPKSESARA